MTDLIACDLCGDQGPLVLHARCHLTAPLAVELNGDELILRCYLPTCRREVGRFRIVRGPARVPTLDPDEEIIGWSEKREKAE